MRISQRSIEEVREAANIVEVASEFTALRRQGARYGGLCPYPDHSEKTPSFSVSPDRGFYYCFGCQRGGDAIKLVSDLKNFSFVEAVSHLAERSGVEIETEGSSPAESRAAKERASRRRSIRKALAAAAVYYHKYLMKSSTDPAQRARRYLKNRGIERSTIEEFRLGYAPPRGSSGFVSAAGRLDLGREVLEAAGLLSSRGGERFAGRITFPISDGRGRIVGFGARALGDEHPKYLNSPETDIFNKRDLLYGFPQVSEAVRKERAALVVEGYTDVLMLYQSGIKNAVATLGTATTPAHLKTLSGYSDRIYILFDPDAAGERAIERAAATATELRLDLRVLRLTKDPADWLLEHSAKEFADLLSGAMPVLEYVFRRKAEHARGANAAERSRLLPEMKDLMREIQDPVFYQDAVRVASETLGVNPEVLQEREASRPSGRPSGDGAPRTRSLPSTEDPLQKAGRRVLSLALAYPDLTSDLLKEGARAPSLPEPLQLETGDFGDDSQAQVFSILRDHAGEELDKVLSDERSRAHLDLISALSLEGAGSVVVSTDKRKRGERLLPSREEVTQAWIGLRILSRNRAKLRADDYDVKERIHSEIRTLKDALRDVSVSSS